MLNSKILPEKEKNSLEFELNKPQILAQLVNANETWMLVGRGGGKTTGGIAPAIIQKIYAMPRSSGGIIGLSFQHLDANTMPPLIKAFTDLGFYKDIHYTYGKRPPDHWPKPYIPMLDFKQAIIWNNGSTIQKVSLKVQASSNALSLQWGIFDEVKFMKPQKLYDEIFPIFRGNAEYFGHQSEYLSKFFATDKKADLAAIKWILDKRKLNDYELINTVISIQLDLNKKQEELEEVNSNQKQKLKTAIKELKWMLNKLRKNMVYVCEASALENIRFLGGEKWLRDKLRNTKDTADFKVTYLNYDPEGATEKFYPDFNEDIHGHWEMNDWDTNKPFILGADYQHSVSPLWLAQPNDLVTGEETLTFFDEVSTVAPQGLTDAINKMCKRYGHYQRKLVYYVYDHTAIGRRNDSETFKDIIVNALKVNKWKVVEVYMGDAPDHYSKYEQIKKILKRESEDMLPISINRQRCHYGITSIKNAGAKTVRGKTQKDKGGETDTDLDQRETTHFSDVFDQINWAYLVMKLVKFRSKLGGVGLR